METSLDIGDTTGHCTASGQRRSAGLERQISQRCTKGHFRITYAFDDLADHPREARAKRSLRSVLDVNDVSAALIGNDRFVSIDRTDEYPH